MHTRSLLVTLRCSCSYCRTPSKPLRPNKHGAVRNQCVFPGHGQRCHCNKAGVTASQLERPPDACRAGRGHNSETVCRWGRQRPTPHAHAHAHARTHTHTHTHRRHSCWRTDAVAHPIFWGNGRSRRRAHVPVRNCNEGVGELLRASCHGGCGRCASLCGELVRYFPLLHRNQVSH